MPRLFIFAFAVVTSASAAGFAQNNQQWRINPGPAPAPQSVDCARLDRDLSQAVDEHERYCYGQGYRKRLQQCIEINRRITAAAYALKPHVKQCRTWTAAEIDSNIAQARDNAEILGETAADSGGSGRRPPPIPSPYQPNNGQWNGVFGATSWAVCERYSLNVDGTKNCY